MKTKDFFGKFLGLYLWGNLFAMGLMLLALGFGVKYGLEIYTHHGEGYEVPDLQKMRSSNARMLLEEKGLVMQVTDSGYNRRLPADVILMQSPGPGVKVKSGHVVYVTVNSPSSPTFSIPDVVDNSSYREAEAKLTALGFKMLPPKRILGERDWVYGILCRGHQVNAGDHVAVDTPLTLLIGNGQYGEDDDIDVEEPEMIYPEEQIPDEVDDFEEVKRPSGSNAGAGENESRLYDHE
jgi:beta-lactam-binding protein with PASTA domain